MVVVCVEACLYLQGVGAQVPRPTRVRGSQSSIGLWLGACVLVFLHAQVEQTAALCVWAGYRSSLETTLWNRVAQIHPGCQTSLSRFPHL